MRVIAGTARSMPLKTIRGTDTRPTTDKTKETLFNILQSHVPDSRFLDLFSGSGGIAIEALSRGAAYAVLVEQNPRAVQCMRENVVFTKVDDRSKNAMCLRRFGGWKDKNHLTLYLWIRPMVRRWSSRCWLTLKTARLRIMTQ